MKVIETVGPLKRKRYNKNKKKAWRKKAQIADVEDLLEEQRREERYGGPLEEKEDKELMFIDIGDDKARKVEKVTYAVDTRPGYAVGFKSSTRMRPVKELLSHRYLKGLPGAKTVHKAKTKEDKVNAVIKKIQTKSEVQAKKKNLEKRVRTKLKQKEEFKKKKPKGAEIEHKMTLGWKVDAWDANSNELVKQCHENGVEEEFINQIVPNARPVNVPGIRKKKTSLLPSVRVPEPGQSYNPSYEDHQILLEKAVRQEFGRRRVDAKENRAVKKLLKMAPPTEETWLAEMSEGLPKSGGNDEDSDGENENAEIEATVTGKRTTERKTKKQRKKENKQKLKQRQKLLAKERRIRESNVFRLKTYKKEIKKCEELLKERQSSRKAFWEQKKSMPHRLGKLKYEPEAIAVSLGHDLHDSLRRSKPVVSLLDERFKNMQRRNLIESRKPAKHQISHLKQSVMKKDHKAVLQQIEEKALTFM